MKQTLKLSNKQKEVIKLMREGWEMGKGTSYFHSAARLQKGGIGCGGDVYKMSLNTFNALVDRLLIVESGRKYPSFIYTLTELGKSIEL